jgi:hypothetical protein
MSFKQYATQYNCSIAEAIADRDCPMNVQGCIEAFKADTGREPSIDEIETMQPDSQLVMQNQREVLHWEMVDYR